MCRAPSCQKKKTDTATLAPVMSMLNRSGYMWAYYVVETGTYSANVDDCGDTMAGSVRGVQAVGIPQPARGREGPGHVLRERGRSKYNQQCTELYDL